MTTGIDVYWSNGDINFWPYEFVILQAYDGATGMRADEHGGWFTRNAKRAADQGAILMTYFWLSPHRPVDDQVRDYLAQVAGWPTLFHWTDVEEPGVGAAQNDRALELLPANAGTYSDGGHYPGSLADARPWWGAGYPRIVGGRASVQIHQYSDKPHDMDTITDDAWWRSVVAPVSIPAPLRSDQQRKGENVGLAVIPYAGNLHTVQVAAVAGMWDGKCHYWGPPNGTTYTELLSRLSIHEELDPSLPVGWDVTGDTMTIELPTRYPARIVRLQFDPAGNWQSTVLTVQ